MQQLDLFYLQQEEPNKSCFSALREHILSFDQDITGGWKFNMPFFFYKGNRFCYFKADRKLGIPYIGFNDGKWVEHPDLVFEDRSRIKIFMVDPTKPLPVETIDSILKAAIAIYD
jgi:hypothetical protein